MVVNLEDVVHRYRVRQAKAQIVGQGRSEKSGSSVSSEAYKEAMEWFQCESLPLCQYI